MCACVSSNLSTCDKAQLAAAVVVVVAAAAVNVIEIACPVGEREC